MHWAVSLIGKPYAALGKGPERFDCFGLLQFCWRERLGWDVPNVLEDAGAAFRAVMRDGGYGAGGFAAFEVDVPAEFDAVYMTGALLPHHVGLWIAPDAHGGVLHASEGAGVAFRRRGALALDGLRIVKILRMRKNGDDPHPV